MSLRSDVIELPPSISKPALTKNVRDGVKTVVTGAAANFPLWSYPAIVPVSSTNATPIVVTTAAGHGYVVGDSVTIANHATNTGANGTWVVSAATSTTLTLTGSVGNGVGGATGTIQYSDPYVLLPDTKIWVQFWALTNGCFVRIGIPDAAAGTTTANGDLIKATALNIGDAPDRVKYYLTPSKHTHVDAYAPSGAGTLSWHICSPPCERERI